MRASSSTGTITCCAGVYNFMADFKQRYDLPLVHPDGTYLFEVVHSQEYETSARHPETRELFVVHSG